jgi:thioredoxin-dependent peroxiredoxin
MVSVDPIALNTAFAKEHEADFPILSDESKAVAKAYGVLGTTDMARRWTFFIGPDGKIIYIEKIVRAATAGEDLAAKLEELGVKKK